MSWASILSGALKLFNALATIFHNKQLMDAGKAEVRSEFTGEALRKVENANKARTTADRADGVPESFYRD